MKMTYIAFYKNKRIEISGEDLTIYAAQVEAAKQLNAKKSYNVNIMLAAKDNKPVIHTAT